jgi:hypothetical protein
MNHSERFKIAKLEIASVIANSLTEEDPGHSQNAWKWLLVLKPDADEVLQLAAFGHDIERALPDRLTRDKFKTYEAFKSTHAKRAGELLGQILKESGYDDDDAARIGKLVGEAEFSSDNPDVQLIADADSISYFDYNVNFYLKRHGKEKTRTHLKNGKITV